MSSISVGPLAWLLRGGAGLAFLLVLAALPLSAGAESRVALVIGNGKYDGNIGPLPNPPRDAEVMTEKLTALGFQVVRLVNGDQKAMKRAISDFGARLVAAGPDAVGLFFYAGHGLQIRGINYLIPVDAAIEREADAELEAVNAEWVLEQMYYAGNNVNIVLLDACRNNPLTRSFRSADRGLARMDAPTGTFIGYSTAPGEVAADGTGKNSPYVAALASEMGKPGIALEETFRNVRVRVMEQTREQQVPWDSSSLTGAFYFGQKQQTVAAVQQPAPAAPAAAGNSVSAAETLFWESVKDSTDPAEFEAYLSSYPKGHYSNLARAELSRLQSSSDVASLERSPEAKENTATIAGGPTTPPAPALPPPQPDSVVQPPPPAAAPEPVPQETGGLVLSDKVSGELDRYLRSLRQGKAAFAVSADGQAAGFYVCEMATQCVQGKRTLTPNRDPNYAKKEALRLCRARGGGECTVIMSRDKAQVPFTRP